MSNFKKKVILTSVFLGTIGFLSGCSTENTSVIEEENEWEETDLALDVETRETTTTGGSCGTDVNFEDLVVETSWISEETGDRDSFNACSVDGEAWMDKYNSGVVMMKCLAADSHRTELKEDNGWESDLSTYKRMRFTAKYTSLPEHGVTIAQVHNRDSGKKVKRPWLRLYIDADRYLKIKETLTTPDQDKSTYDTHEGLKYTSGQEITVTVWTGLSGQEKVKIHVEVGEESFQETLYLTSDWDDYVDTFYLKAGVYTEGDEDRTCTVKYSKFEIKH